MRTNKEYLEMAQEIDGMDRDVTTWEADFIDSVLSRLRGGGGISVK